MNMKQLGILSIIATAIFLWVLHNERQLYQQEQAERTGYLEDSEAHK